MIILFGFVLFWDPDPVHFISLITITLGGQDHEGPGEEAGVREEVLRPPDRQHQVLRGQPGQARIQGKQKQHEQQQKQQQH